jgi:hypothetical protein
MIIGRRLGLGQVLVYKLHGHRTLAERRGDPLDQAVSHVAGGEDPRRDRADHGQAAAVVVLDHQHAFCLRVQPVGPGQELETGHLTQVLVSDEDGHPRVPVSEFLEPLEGLWADRSATIVQSPLKRRPTSAASRSSTRASSETRTRHGLSTRPAKHRRGCSGKDGGSRC